MVSGNSTDHEYGPHLQQVHRTRPSEASWTADITMASVGSARHSDQHGPQKPTWLQQGGQTVDIRLALNGNINDGYQYSLWLHWTLASEGSEDWEITMALGGSAYSGQLGPHCWFLSFLSLHYIFVYCSGASPPFLGGGVTYMASVTCPALAWVLS